MIKSLEEISLSKGEYGGGFSAVEYFDGAPRYIRITDINEEGKLNETIKAPSGESKEWKKYKLKKGDILFARTGATVGKTFLYDESYGDCIYAGYLIRFTPNPKICFPKYIYYYTKTPEYFSWVEMKQNVVAQPNINAKQYGSELDIPLPPLPQQQKIANILDAADALRQNDKALVAKYDELIQALFLDMFGDPVSNPKGWEKLELGKAIDVRDGTHDSPKYVEKGYPLVTSKNIKNGELVLDNVNYISQEDYNKINNRSKVDVGDIIMPMIGTIGNPLLVDFEVNFAIKNVALFKFNDKSIITNIMLLNLLNGHFLERFSSLNNKGGTQKFVSLGDIRKMLVPIPPITLQNQFAERVTLIEEQKTIAQASLLKSEELFNSLLQKAFKGELVN